MYAYLPPDSVSWSFQTTTPVSTSTIERLTSKGPPMSVIEPDTRNCTDRSLPISNWAAGSVRPLMENSISSRILLRCSRSTSLTCGAFLISKATISTKPLPR